MASDTLTTMQYSLLRAESRLIDLTTKFWKEPLMALMKDGNKITRVSAMARGMIRYFNVMLYPSGGFAQVSSGGDYPPAQQESEIQPYITMQLYGFTVSYTEHALSALEKGGRDVVLMDLQTKINKSVEHTQRRIGRLMMMRGDGVVARASAAGTTSTAFTSSIPLGLVVGDIVYAKKDSSGDGRGLAGSTTINGIRVTAVDYVNSKFTLASNQTWTDNDVVYILRAANNASGAGVYLHGIQAMIDDKDDNTQWDSDDDSTYDHVDTYLGLTRSSTGQANAQIYNASSTSPDISMFGTMVNYACAKGADPSDLFVLIHPTTWQAYTDAVVGFADRRVDLQLPGGNYSVPVLDGVGQEQIKVIIDWSMPTDKIVLLDTGKLYQLTAQGGWNRRTGALWQRNAAASSTNPAASAYTAFFDIWKQVALVLPETSVMAYGVTTS